MSAPLNRNRIRASRLDELPLVLTVQEAAGILRIGTRQLRQLIARDELYAAKIGRSIRIPRAAVERFLAGPQIDEQPARLAVVK